MSDANRPLTQTIRHIRAFAGERPATDAQLLDRFVRLHDEPAFAELVARHGPLVQGVARRWLADRDEAEDVVQATFLALARQATRLDRGKPLTGWLYTVAFRLARKAQLQSSRRGRHVASRVRQPDPLDDITGRELLRALDAAGWNAARKCCESDSNRAG